MTQAPAGELKGFIQTVSGLIEPQALGCTLMHEHLLIDVAPPSLNASADPAALQPVRACDCFKLTWGQKTLIENYHLTDPRITDRRWIRRRCGPAAVGALNSYVFSPSGAVKSLGTVLLGSGCLAATAYYTLRRPLARQLEGDSRGER